MIERYRWWRKVRAAKKWQKRLDQESLIAKHQKALTRVTEEERREAMKSGIFI